MPRSHRNLDRSRPLSLTEWPESGPGVFTCAYFSYLPKYIHSHVAMKCCPGFLDEIRFGYENSWSVAETNFLYTQRFWNHTIEVGGANRISNIRPITDRDGLRDDRHRSQGQVLQLNICNLPTCNMHVFGLCKFKACNFCQLQDLQCPNITFQHSKQGQRVNYMY